MLREADLLETELAGAPRSESSPERWRPLNRLSKDAELDIAAVRLRP